MLSPKGDRPAVSIGPNRFLDWISHDPNRDIHIDHNPDDINNPRDERIAHNGWIQPDFFKQEWQYGSRHRSGYHNQK